MLAAETASIRECFAPALATHGVPRSPDSPSTTMPWRWFGITTNTSSAACMYKSSRSRPRPGRNRSPSTESISGGGDWDRTVSAREREASLDELRRLHQHFLRDGQPERAGGLQVDDEVELGRLLHRQIGRLGSLQDLVDVGGGPVVHV